MYCVIYNCICIFFSIHVLTSFLHGYSATLAAKLIIKLELSSVELRYLLTYLQIRTKSENPSDWFRQP